MTNNQNPTTGREKIEQIFDEKFDNLWLYAATVPESGNINLAPEVKNFIFDIVLPEVLSTIMSKKDICYTYKNDNDCLYTMGYNHCIDDFEKNIFNKYGIDLTQKR